MALLPSEKLRRLRERSPLEVDLSEEQTQRHLLGRRRSGAQRLLLALAVLACAGFGLTVGYVMATRGGDSSPEGPASRTEETPRTPASFSPPTARNRWTDVDRAIARRFQTIALAQANGIIQHAVVVSQPAARPAGDDGGERPHGTSIRPRPAPDRPDVDTRGDASNRIHRAFDRLLRFDQYDPYAHAPE